MELVMIIFNVYVVIIIKALILWPLVGHGTNSVYWVFQFFCNTICWPLIYLIKRFCKSKRGLYQALFVSRHRYFCRTILYHWLKILKKYIGKMDSMGKTPKSPWLRVKYWMCSHGIYIFVTSKRTPINFVLTTAASKSGKMDLDARV